MKAKLEPIVANLLGYTWLGIVTLGSVSLLIATVKWFLSLVGVM